MDGLIATLTISGPLDQVSRVALSLVNEGIVIDHEDEGEAGKDEGAAEVPGAPRANSGELVTLNRDEFGRFYEGIASAYQKGIRLLCKRNGTVSWSDLKDAGIASPGHFKSRLSLRAKKVLGLSKRVQFVKYEWSEAANDWFMTAPPQTISAMKDYFSKK